MSELTTTAPAEPLVSGSHVAGAAGTDSYKEQIKRQTGGVKDKQIKSFADLNIKNLPEMDENQLAEKPEDLLALQKKKSASEVLRKQEKQQNVQTSEKNEAPEKEENILGEIEDLTSGKADKPGASATKSKELNFKELRQKAEAAEARARELEEKESSYQAKLKEMEDTLEKTNFERSPKFQEKYRAPKEESESAFKQFSKDIAEDESLADRALSLPIKERIAFIDEHFGGGAASAEALRLANDVEAKRGAYNKALEKARETALDLKVEEQKQVKKSQEDLQSNFDSVSSRISERLSLFRKGKDDDHNALVDKRISHARAIIMGDAPEEDIMVAPFLAVIAKDVIQENNNLKAEIKKYKDRVKQENSYEPSINGGDTGENEPVGKPVGAMESIKRQLKGVR